MKKNLINEFDLIDSLIIHKPSNEIAQMKFENLNSDDKEKYLLFDDILYYEKALKEHNEFTDTIKAFTNKKNCLELDALLREVLSNKKTRKDFISDIGCRIADCKGCDSIVNMLLTGDQIKS